MKKTTFLSLAFFFFPALSWATTPLDYCDGQLAQSLKQTYNLEGLDQYRGYLREILNHPHDVLQGHVDEAGAGPVDVPLAIATDILQAENRNADTRRLLDELRVKYTPSPQLALLDADFQPLAIGVLPPDVAANWEGCGITCRECRANVGNVKNGIHYQILGQENQLFAIALTYLPSQESDPVSVVITEVDITGGTLAEPVVLKRSQALHRYIRYTQAIRRAEPDTEVGLRIELQDQDGLAFVIGNQIPEKGASVGTIVPSMLPWPQYAETVGDGVAFDAAKNYWSPCDGRGITGSRLGNLLERARAPDLRGVFLRGLNQFAPDDESAGLVGAVSPEQRDPGEKKGGAMVMRMEAGILQGHNVGAHGHIYRGSGAQGIANAEDGGDIDRVWWSGDHNQSGTRGTEKNPTGEPRPKNVAVHYYVKIN